MSVPPRFGFRVGERDGEGPLHQVQPVERPFYATNESAGAEPPSRRIYDANQTNLLTQDLAADLTARVGDCVEIDIGEAIDQVAQVRRDQ